MLEHVLSTRSMARFSIASNARPQRYFTATHVTTYVHLYEAELGSHSAGSRSDLDRFDAADTAISDFAYPRSFANACRFAADQLFAPESHASFSGTKWSMSKEDEFVVRTPSYSLTQVAPTMVHPDRFPPTASAMSTHCLVSQPFEEIQCLNFERW